MEESVKEDKTPLQLDIEKYQKELQSIQEQINALDAKKEQLFRIGVRLEGVISYIKLKMEEAAPKDVGSPTV